MEVLIDGIKYVPELPPTEPTQTGYTTLDPNKKGTAATLLNGNLTYTGIGLGTVGAVRGIKSGEKKVWQVVMDDLPVTVGMVQADADFNLGLAFAGLDYFSGNGKIRVLGTLVKAITPSGKGDIIRFEFNADPIVDNRVLEIFKNNVSVGTVTEEEIFLSSSFGSFAGEWFPAGGVHDNAGWPSGATFCFGPGVNEPTPGFSYIAGQVL